MKCEDFAHMLDNYDSLTEEEKVMMNIHADTCEGCKRELELMVSIINATKTLPEIPVPEDFIAKLNKRIDAETSNDRYSFIRHLQHNWQRYSAAAACLVLAVVIGSNYNMIVNRSTNVPASVTQTAKPQTETKAEKDATGNNTTANVGEKRNNADNSYNTAVNDIARVSTENDNRQDNDVKETPVVSVNPAVSVSQAAIENTAAPSNNNSEHTFSPVRGRYVEGRAVDVTPEPSPQSEQGGDFSIGQPGIAVAHVEAPENTAVPADSGNEDYRLSDNMIVISSDDYGETMHIIDRYILGTYDNEYYVADRDDFARMLERLEAEGIGFSDYILADSNEIIFRIASE